MQIFEVLADPVRRRILELLAPREMASGEVVEVIGAEFGITQAAVSQHLKVLRESGFATVRAGGAETTLFGRCRGPAGGGCMDRSIQKFLGAEAGRAGDRDRARQTRAS
ncbi:putative ArsR family transcriptional regulator [Bradyrhizobium sp. LM3.6]